MNILSWYNQNKRNLPWRETKDPYIVWVSEIILQQTRIAQGTDYFLAFIKKFPTLSSLSKANEKEVLKIWQGLGYYSRARNMHFTSKFLMNELGGEFPIEFSELIKLKGIGRYTAAAIASISFDEVVPALDGNAYRVYSRYFGLEVDVSKSNAWNVFYKASMNVIDPLQPGDFNQAIMELGATLCKPKNPDCIQCPIQSKCYAFEKNEVTKFPIKNRKINIRERFFHYVLVKNKTDFLIRKRTGNDIWKNLYELPNIELNKKQSYKNIRSKGIELKGNLVLNNQNLVFLKHQITLLTHQKINLYFWQTELQNFDKHCLDDFELIGLNQGNLFPFPKPIADFVINLKSFV